MTEVFLQLPPPLAEQVQWYAIQTRYRFERSVMKQLQSKGVKTYLPLLEELHAWSDRSKAVDIPLFSGYGFVRLDLSSGARVGILQSRGVIGLVTVAGAVLLILWFALRSKRVVLAVLISLFVGFAITAAFGLALVGALNPISIAFAVLFVGIGVDFGIQVAVRYRRERHLNNHLEPALDAAVAVADADDVRIGAELVEHLPARPAGRRRGRGRRRYARRADRPGRVARAPAESRRRPARRSQSRVASCGAGRDRERSREISCPPA